MLNYDVDWGVTAQMLSAWAAIIAVFLGPFLAFQVSRRLAISQSRQQWLDGVRSDLAELISLHGDYVSNQEKYEIVRESLSPDAVTHLRQMDMLLGRVRMRLNVSEVEQKHLMEKVSAYISCYDQSHEDYNPNGIYRAFDEVRDSVWRDIKLARG